jgi:C_GCAxxG_C_C family probable redox protein
MSEERDLRTLASDYAIENYKNGLNCAECVYEALLRCGALKAPKETIAMTTGFGGGIGATGHTCGALSAAVMACGAVYGRPDPWSVPKEHRGSELRAKYYRRYNKMVNDFIEANTSATCKEICAPYSDWHSRERRINCLKLIGRTAAMAVDFLNMSQEEAFSLPYGKRVEDK